MAANRPRRRAPGPGPIAAALAAAFVVVLGVVLPASPAAAHAVLLSSTPADRAVLDAAPAEVSLEFSESVSAAVGAVRAFDSGGRRVDEGDLEVDGPRIRLGLRGGLGDGAYVVTYRVLSADSHPVAGAFTFTVGDVAAVDDSTVAGLLGEDDDRTWHIAGAVARALAYAGALGAAGLAAFLVLAHDGGEEASRLRRWVVRGAATGAVGVVAAIPFQAALATGLGLRSITERGVLGPVLDDGVGASSAIVLAGLALLAVDRGRRLVPSMAGAVFATTGFASAGHTATTDPRQLVTMVDGLHAAAGAVWFGGLLGLIVILRRRRGDAAASAGPVVARFSTMAALSLLAVAAAGTYLAWREVRTWSALTSTTYGKVLIAKVAVVGVVAALGGWNRFRLVPALATAPRKAAALLRRVVRVEGGALLVAIALTGVLVNITPARTAAGIGTIFSDTVPFGDGSLNVVVDPNRVGTNAIHLYLFDDAGRVSEQELQDLTIELSLPSAAIGPLSRTPFQAGRGHYQLDGSDLSIAGRWTLEVLARVDRFDQVSATVTLTVNP